MKLQNTHLKQTQLFVCHNNNDGTEPSPQLLVLEVTIKNIEHSDCYIYQKNIHVYNYFCTVLVMIYM